MTLVSGSIEFDVPCVGNLREYNSRGFPGHGASNNSEVVTTAILSNMFAGCIFGNFRYYPALLL